MARGLISRTLRSACLLDAWCYYEPSGRRVQLLAANRQNWAEENAAKSFEINISGTPYVTKSSPEQRIASTDDIVYTRRTSIHFEWKSSSIRNSLPSKSPSNFRLDLDQWLSVNSPLMNRSSRRCVSRFFASYSLTRFSICWYKPCHRT